MLIEVIFLYIELTTEEAIEMLKKSKGKKVMIAVCDLEKENVEKFFVRLKTECVELINTAETIASLYDDYIKQLHLFSEKQNLQNIEKRGKQNIILLK